MADREIASAAIDAAFAHHMRELFEAMCRHVAKSGDLPTARKVFRESFITARQARNEMLAIAEELTPQ